MKIQTQACLPLLSAPPPPSPGSCSYTQLFPISWPPASVCRHPLGLLNATLQALPQPVKWEKILIVSDHKVCRELINSSKRIFALKALLTGVHFLSWHKFSPQQRLQSKFKYKSWCLIYRTPCLSPRLHRQSLPASQGHCKRTIPRKHREVSFRGSRFPKKTDFSSSFLYGFSIELSLFSLTVSSFSWKEPQLIHCSVIISHKQKQPKHPPAGKWFRKHATSLQQNAVEDTNK